MLNAIFLPIKPDYSERIMTGEKVFEYRKKLPKQDVDYVVVYASSPHKKVVGYATIRRFHTLVSDELWRLTKEHSGISREFFDSYFIGMESASAIELVDVMRFVNPFDPDKVLGERKVPQSFCYLTRGEMNKLKRRKACPV